MAAAVPLVTLCASLLTLRIIGGDYVVYDVRIEDGRAEQAESEVGDPLGIFGLLGSGDFQLMADFVESPPPTYNFTEPRDFVVVMDTSQSFSSKYFNDTKAILETLIKTGVIVHPEYTRIAVITFDLNFATRFNAISEGSLTECELFASHGPWQDIEFVVNQHGSNIAGALDEASYILSLGRLNRPGIVQDLFLLTDAEHFGVDALVSAQQLRSAGVNVYTVGAGNQLNVTILESMSSQPASYYYHFYTDWQTLLQRGQVQSKQDVMQSIRETAGGWTVVGQDLCPGCGSGAACYCENFLSIDPVCLCQVGFTENNDTRCIECMAGTYKETFGNTTCTECPASLESDRVSSIVTEQCTLDDGLWSPIILAYVGVNVLVVITCIGGIIYICRYRRHKRREKQRNSESGHLNIYTQTYDGSQPEVAGTATNRAYCQPISTQTQLENGVASVHAYLTTGRTQLQHKWSENSSDSGVAMDTPPTPGRNHVFTFSGNTLEETKEDDAHSISSASDIHESRETIMAIRRQYENSVKEPKMAPVSVLAEKRPSKLKRWRKKLSGKSSVDKPVVEEEPQSVSNIVKMFELKPPPLKMAAPSVSLTLPTSPTSPRDSATYVEPDTPTEDDDGYMIPSPTVPRDKPRHQQVAGRSVSADPQVARHFKTNASHPKLNGASRSHEPATTTKTSGLPGNSHQQAAVVAGQGRPQYRHHISLIDRSKNGGAAPLPVRTGSQTSVIEPAYTSRNSYLEITENIPPSPTVHATTHVPSYINPLFQGD